MYDEVRFADSSPEASPPHRSSSRVHVRPFTRTSPWLLHQRFNVLHCAVEHRR